MSSGPEHWDSVWDEIFSRPWGKYPPEYVVRFVARTWPNAKERANVRMLDLGSGPGAITWFLAREGFAAFAIDGSAVAIALLNARLAAEGLSATTAVQDYIRLPWPTAFFDGVIDNVSLYCNPLDRSAEILKEVRRILKPGGIFFSATFTDRTWGCGTGTRFEPGGYTDIAEGPCAGKSFSRFLARDQIAGLYSGFRELSVERTGWTLGDMAHTVELWLITCRK